MKITQIELIDYGPYGDMTNIDLRTTDDRPIILFGGQNGAGKTTLFNAIQICLHGRSAFESHLSRQEYEEFLRSKLHESTGRNATEARIRLEFEYADFGETDTYAVERSFRDRGKSVVDELTVRRNGTQLTELEEDQWDDFLKELIPPGISQLFFFDGEKVEKLAGAIAEDDDFAESLVSLLGLDLVERLDTDLGIYISRKLDEGGHEELVQEIEDLREEIEEHKERKNKLKNKIDKKEDRITEIEGEIESLEQDLAEEGGTFANKRDDYKEQRARLKEKIETLEREIRELARTEYPFMLAPDLCRQVVDRLEQEVEAERKEAAQSEAVDALDQVADEVLDNKDYHLSEDAAGGLVSQIQESLAEQLEPDLDIENDRKLSPQFSDEEQRQIRSLVDRALHEVPDELAEITEELEATTRELQDVEAKISNAPGQSVLQPILSEINDLTAEKAELQAEIENHRDDLEAAETMFTRTKNSLENRLSKQDELEDVSRRTELASTAQDAIQAYRDRLIDEKMEQLETALTERYLRLTNKPGYYDGVEVNKEDMSFSVVTVDGDKKHQSQLSAGERQIFATAMLWALADISGRPLPFIIDTPLGRLDTEHRDNIVENFFPEAAHQVFLFSTDTEIVGEHYETVREFASAEYHLVNHNRSGRTTVSPGYFNTDEGEAIQKQLDIQADMQITEQAVENEKQSSFTKFSNVQ